MKMYGIGNLFVKGEYAVVMANSESEALRKVAQFGKNSLFKTNKAIVKEHLCLKRGEKLNVEVIENGIWFGDNN